MPFFGEELAYAAPFCGIKRVQLLDSEEGDVVCHRVNHRNLGRWDVEVKLAGEDTIVAEEVCRAGTRRGGGGGG